jgi:Arc/MetJ-type ribon-helix-helix transcriptional regulator
MKTRSESSVNMPAALLAEVQAAAEEEHRPADELVRDAVRRYLEGRRLQQGKDQQTPNKNLAELLMESPFAGAELDLERRKDYAHPIEL